MSSFRGIIPIFKGPFLECIARGKHHSVLRELLTHLPSCISFSEKNPLAEWYDVLYSMLLGNYKCEYIYKNSIALQLYLKFHNPQQALLTDEFNIGQSRADVVVFNRTSTVYEIKTEFDTMNRLESQLFDYARVFDNIYVVTTSKRYKDVLNELDNMIGIYIMEERGELHRVRDASSNKSSTDPAAIFCCMRRAEYLSALEEEFGYEQDVPNGHIWRRAFNLFKEIPPERAHELMVNNVSKRAANKPFSQRLRDIPKPLKYTCLSFNRNKSVVPRVIEKLGDPVLLL